MVLLLLIHFLLEYLISRVSYLGNYSVEQADDKVIMKFTNVEFFEKLLKAIQNRYKQLDCSSSVSNQYNTITKIFYFELKANFQI